MMDLNNEDCDSFIFQLHPFQTKHTAAQDKFMTDVMENRLICRGTIAFTVYKGYHSTKGYSSFWNDHMYSKPQGVPKEELNNYFAGCN